MLIWYRDVNLLLTHHKGLMHTYNRKKENLKNKNSLCSPTYIKSLILCLRIFGYIFSVCQYFMFFKIWSEKTLVEMDYSSTKCGKSSFSVREKEYYYKLFDMLSQNIFVLPYLSSLCFPFVKGHWQARILLIQHFWIPAFVQFHLVLYKGK